MNKEDSVLLTRIEVYNLCCGKTAVRSVLRCSNCDKYYMHYSDEHFMDGDTVSTDLISKEEAEDLTNKIKKCKNDHDCNCEIHVYFGSLFIGERVFSKSYPY